VKHWVGGQVTIVRRRAFACVGRLYPQQVPPVGLCERASLVLCRTHSTGREKRRKGGILSALPSTAQHSRNGITFKYEEFENAILCSLLMGSDYRGRFAGRGR